jgi:hypothetical protein
MWYYNQVTEGEGAFGSKLRGQTGVDMNFGAGDLGLKTRFQRQ